MVLRPEECTDLRTPFPPTDAPTPLFETLSRTPGATLIDFRIRNPIATTPPVDSAKRQAKWVPQLFLAPNLRPRPPESAILSSRCDRRTLTAPGRWRRYSGVPAARLGAHLEVRTGVRTRRAFPASPAHLTRSTMPFPFNHAAANGRSWDRTSDLPRVKRALSR